MESISLDASLNLPTIDPAPTRTATLPADSHRRFDDELRRASSPTLEERSRSRQTDSNKPRSGSDVTRRDDPAAAGADNDSPGDDAIVDENVGPGDAGVAAEASAKSDSADEADQQDESASADADATAAAATGAQASAEKVATKPTAPVGAQAQPEQIDALRETTNPTGDSAAKSTPTAETDALAATSDTPDVTAEKRIGPDVVGQGGELHAASTSHAKSSADITAASQQTTDTEPTSVQAATVSTNAAPTETVADHDDRGNKKQHAARQRTAAADDGSLEAKLADAAQRDEANSQSRVSAIAAMNDEAAQAAADTTAQIAASADDTRSGSSQASATTSVTNPHAAELSGKGGAGAPSTAAAGSTVTQKLLDGTSRSPARGGDNASEVDRARFVQRVSKAFQTASERGGPLRLRLSPPELGSVRMEVSIRGGVMTARLEAETTTAQTMLLDNLPALRERLAQHNIKVERFDVDLLGQSGDGSQQSPTDTSDRQATRTAPAAQQRRTAAVATDDKPTAAPARRASGSGQLNVII